MDDQDLDPVQPSLKVQPEVQEKAGYQEHPREQKLRFSGTFEGLCVCVVLQHSAGKDT